MKFIIAIPFYKNERFIDFFVNWYDTNPQQHACIDRVVVINDCPEGDSHYLSNVCLENKFEFIENKQNIGYLKTTNIAIGMAINSDSHLILLNSDTRPYANFLTEIADCFASDSNLAVVAPRSNNATICNLYNQPEFIEDEKSIDKFIADFHQFKKLTTKVSYTPTVTGFCFCIRNEVLRIFGGFEIAFSPGYEEENEFCLRVTERGMRVGVANHAFVAHYEGKSFGLTSSREFLRDKNQRLINQLYPYYQDLISRFSSTMDAHCLRKISESLRFEGRLLIHASNFGPYYNGTNKLVVEFTSALSALSYQFDLIASEEAVKFHALQNLPGLNRVDAPLGVYQTGIRIGQPFDENGLTVVPMHSIISICVFFDVISHDCPQLISENPCLTNLWERMPYLYTDISFISRYAKEQFATKFGSGLAKLDDALLPLIVDRCSGEVVRGSDYDHDVVLVIGNKFKHKAVDMVFRELPKEKNRIYYVLGEVFEVLRDDVKFLTPGMVSEQEMSNLMKSSKFIVFPTFSEGFGFPILEALQYKKNIYCRPLPPFVEIYNSIDAEMQGHLKFVSNFKLDEGQASVDTQQPPGNFFLNYADYVAHILNVAHQSSGSDIFQSLRSKEHFLGRHVKPTSKLNPNMIRILYCVYRLVKKFPGLRDAAQMIRARFKAAGWI
jgi:GT2 family glycosyltransferase